MAKTAVSFGRRLERRFVEKCEVDLMRESDGPKQGFRTGVTNDLSEWGLSVSLQPINWNPGDEILVTVHLPFPSQRITIRSIIQWRRSEDDLDWVGLRFVESFGNRIVFEDFLSRSKMVTKEVLDRRVEVGKNDKVGAPYQSTTDRRIAKPASPPPLPTSTVEKSDHWISPLAKVKPESPLREFSLLVGGKLVKTDNYEFYPYTEKMILDWKGTRSRISQLKKGIQPVDWADYVYAKYYVASPETNQLAINSAHDASLEFQNFPLAKRHKIMVNIYDLLLENKAQLIDLMVIEGHPVSLAEWEYEGMLAAFNPETLSFYKGELLREMGVKGEDDIFIVRRPDGVVCLVPPRNAPCSIPIIAAFALLAGNSMIVKPPLRSPVSCSFLWQEIVYKAARMAGAPAGVINTVIGNSETIMKEWLESPKINDIFFFGESKQGLEIGLEAFRRGKKPILELAGNDFMLVWKDAPLDQAVESIVEGLRGSLQICMAPKKALVHPAIFEEFCNRMVKAVQAKARVGLPSDPKTYLTPVGRIRECEMTLQQSLEKGARLLVGGTRVNHLGQSASDGMFFEATVIALRTTTPLSFECIAEENFFPLLPLVSLPSEGSVTDQQVFEWMLSVVSANQYALRTSVWVQSKQWLSLFAQNISNCGLLRINAPHTGFSTYLSVNGGARRSGGPFGEMNYPWLKTSRLQGVSIRW